MVVNTATYGRINRCERAWRWPRRGSPPTMYGTPHSSAHGLVELGPGFAESKVAMVLNTGALERPLTRAQYQSGLQAPSNLFSHSDQTLQAQTATSNTIGGGWGGRLLDVFGVNDTLGAISVSSAATFLQSSGNAPNVIPPGASLGLSGMNISPTSAAAARKQAVAAMLAMDGGHPLRAATNSAFADGLQLAETLAGTGSAANINTVFPGTGLGTQMREVARADQAAFADRARPSGVLLLDGRLRHPHGAGLQP